MVKQVRALSYEVLLVDDGSKDDTAKLAKEAGAIVLRHMINRGQGSALRTGIKYALNNNFSRVVFFDADGQMAPVEISKILLPLQANQCQVALGSRFLGQTKNMPWSRLITLKLALLFTRLTTGLKLTDVHNGFQAWSAEALKKLSLVQDRQAYASEILQELADKKIKYQEVPVTIEYTEYSKKKGQSVFNAFNILWDLIIKK